VTPPPGTRPFTERDRRSRVASTRWRPGIPVDENLKVVA
jgi:hypothetical protein